MKRLLVALVAMALVFVVASGCGSKYAGTYVDSDKMGGTTNAITLKLDSSGKFTMVVESTAEDLEKIEGINPTTLTHSGTYTVEGDKLTLQGDGWHFDGKVVGDGFVVGNAHFKKQ